MYTQLAGAPDACVRKCIELDGSDNAWRSAFLRDVAWVNRFCPIPRTARCLLTAFHWIPEAAELLACAEKALSAHCRSMKHAQPGTAMAEDDPAVVEPPPLLACPVCAKAFGNRRQLSTHAARVHGVLSAARFFTTKANTCWACRTCFHTRKRMIYHLGQCSPSCLAFLRAHFHPLPLETVEALDSRTRKGGPNAGVLSSTWNVT